MEEETQIETAKRSETLIGFNPPRRRSLKSETHRILVRILSHFYDASEDSAADSAQNVPQELNQGNGTSEMGKESEKEVSEDVPQELNQGNGTGEIGKASEKEVSGNVEAVDSESMDVDNSAAEQVMVVDEGGCGTNGLLEEIEQMKDIFDRDDDEDCSLLEAMDFENMAMEFGFNLQDFEHAPGEMVMDEPEQIVTGDDDRIAIPSTTSLVPNDGGSDTVKLSSNQEEYGDFQHRVTVEPGNADQVVSETFDSSVNNVVIDGSFSEGECNENTSSFLKTSKIMHVEPIMERKTMGPNETSIPSTEAGEIEKPENLSERVPEACVSSLVKDMVSDASKPSECSKDKSLSEKANHLEVEQEMRWKDNEVERIGCIRNATSSPNHMDDGETEEGEISDDGKIDDRSIDILLHDTVRSEQNKYGVPIFKDMIGKKEQSFKEPISKEFGPSPSSFTVGITNRDQNLRGLELGESRTMTISRPEVVQGKTIGTMYADDYDFLLDSKRTKEKDGRFVNDVVSTAACNNNSSDGNFTEENGAESHETKSVDKGDAGASNKRKRGPLSKEKKQRKKARERMKRAENNRKQGVTRPILHMIEKPKTVNLCRHYIEGRCREGDKCNFSHDTVPKTKSKPCSFFARQSCMKGDDCPFDHDLSKYSCVKFAANGFCIRGDQCLFSHKIPSKGEGATAAQKPESVSPSVQFNSKSPQVKIGSSSQKNVHSHNNIELIMARTLLEQPVMTTKGVSLLSTGDPSSVHSSESKRGVLVPDGNTGAKAGNLIQQSPSTSAQSSKEILMRTAPVVTPKGINFLSFGKVTPDGSSGKNQIHHQTNPSVSETVQNWNGMLKVDRHAEPLQKDIQSFGKVSVANSSGGNPFSLSSSSESGNNRLLANSSGNPFSLSSSSGNGNNRLLANSSSGNPFSLSSSSEKGSNSLSANSSSGNPFSLSSSSDNGNNTADKPQNSPVISLRLPPSPLTLDHSASRFHKDTENQRALYSTLAFAANLQKRATK